jgi:hypothetical protein
VAQHFLHTANTPQYVPIVPSLDFRSFFMVLVVSNAICISVFMNSFVIVLVLGQYCVKVARLDFCFPVSYW